MMNIKKIIISLVLCVGAFASASEQSMQQEQMPRELVVEIFVRNLPKYTNQEALNALKALRETNKSFANDQGLQQAIHSMKIYNKLRPYYSNYKLHKDQITLIATLLRAQEWLRNNTQSVDSLVLNILEQYFDRPRELPLLNMLETVWPLSSQKFVYTPYGKLVLALYTPRDTSVDIACETAKFLYKKNIPLNNQKPGYCEALQLMIEKIKSANINIITRGRIYPNEQKIFENFKILYKCLKDLGARLDPKYQEEAKKAGLE